jgi:phosphoglycerate kinase
VIMSSIVSCVQRASVAKGVTANTARHARTLARHRAPDTRRIERKSRSDRQLCHGGRRTKNESSKNRVVTFRGCFCFFRLLCLERDRTLTFSPLPPFSFLQKKQGRPEKGPEDKFRLTPIGARLSESLSCSVTKLDDCVGDVVKDAVAAMENGSVCLLENVRFYPDEEKNGKDFAKQLAEHADLYVNDAFGTAHRAHASTAGVTEFLSPCVAGFLLQKELDYLDGAVSNPERPFCAIVGGSKVSSKIGVIETLLNKADKVILGGGMIFTFYKAMGKSVGASLVEDDKIELAKELMASAKAKGVQLLLPTDVIVADKFAEDAKTQIVSVDAIPDGWMGLDIGPDSLKEFQKELKECKSVIWNGPMGVFEMEAFNKGTFGVCDTLAELDAITIIGGGDSVAAVEMAGLADKMSHISTGGGASLELLEGKVLPGVDALDEA